MGGGEEKPGRGQRGAGRLRKLSPPLSASGVPAYSEVCARTSVLLKDDFLWAKHCTIELLEQPQIRHRRARHTEKYNAKNKIK